MDNIKTLIINQKESLSSLEEKSKKLQMDSPFKVRLPSAIHTKGALGVEVALLQLIGTWIKFNKHKKILHSYQQANPADFVKICSSIYGICSLSTVDEVWDVGGTVLPRGLVLDSAKQIIEDLRKHKFNAFSNRYFGVPYIKTEKYDKELEMPFYNGGKVVESGSFFNDFDKLLRENVCFHTLSRYKNLSRMIDIEDLSNCLWELLKNTDDHGRRDRAGNFLSENTRAIIVQQQSIEKPYWGIWCGDNPSETQVKFSKLWSSKEEKINFIDISVFDLGLGFYELAQAKVGSNEPVNVLLKCFEPGWSRLNEKSRGAGLSKVLHCIHKYRGWLRIRTGNLLLEKTYSDGESAEVTYRDIQSMDSVVAGTAIHISLPLPNFS